MISEKCIQVMIALLEVWLCYQFLYVAVIEKQFLTKFEKGIVLFNIVTVGLMFAINRNLLFFSHVMFGVAVLITTMCAWIIKRKNFLIVLGVVILYYSSVALLDFFFAFGSMIFLEDEFYQAVYKNSDSFWQEIIFICSRIIIGVGISLLQKKQEIKKSFIASRNMLFVVSGVFCIVLRKYQFELCNMADGTVPRRGGNAGFSLVAVVAMSVFVIFIFVNNRKIQEENRLLLQIEEMSEHYYTEASQLLEKNHQLVHDIKNHFIVIKKYAENGEKIELCQYIEEISSNLFKDEVRCWTGNKILDLVLTSKKSIAEYKGIDFQITANLCSMLPFCDSESCSLFGNLLDNALEACERMKEGEKWITVSISKKKRILFVEIINSIGEEPLIRNGKWISLKNNKSVHGYGLKSIERIVEKYEGTICYKTEKDVASVNITFFNM